MIHKRVLLMLVVAALTVVVGCKVGENPSSGGPTPDGSEPRLLRQPRPPIADLPVPVNFDLDEKKSGNLDAPGVRLVDHLYKGRDDKVAVRAFYEKEMPGHQWKLASNFFSQGAIILIFEKSNERCHIEISDGNWWRPTHIRARIYTAGPGSPGAQPPKTQE